MDKIKEDENEVLSIEEIVDLGDDALGLKVIVNSKETTLMGVISFIIPASRRLSIEKVSNPKTGQKIPGMRNILFFEIISVAVIGVDKKYREMLLKNVYQEEKRGKQLLMKKLVPPHLADTSEDPCEVDEDILLGRVGFSPGGGGKTKAEDSQEFTPPPPPPPKVKRPEKWIVIDAVDDAFKKAISVIQSESDISLALEGENIGRSGTLAWLSIATSSIIFLFDMVKMGTVEAFEAGLKEILTDINILKIVHDCRPMEDMLHHQFSISLKNVFDTQAADVYVYMINHKGTVPMFTSGLPTLLIRYLKLSNHHVFFSRVREECSQNDESIWFERPLPTSLCEGLARCVMYLRELRLVLLQLMLVDLAQITNLYLGSMRDKDSATVINIEPHVVPVEVQKLGRRRSNNSINVHDPYINYSRDSFKILSKRK